MFTGILTLAVLTHAAWAVFWGAPHDRQLSEKTVKEVPATIWAGMVVLAGLTILLGIYPQAVYPLLNGATNALLAR